MTATARVLLFLSAGAAAVFMGSCAVAESPRLPEVGELKGVWTVSATDGPARCQVVLDDRPAPGGYVLLSSCLGTLGLGDVSAWRPAPDGIALTDADSRSVAFFSRRDQRSYTAMRQGGRALVLEPAAGSEGGPSARRPPS